MRDLWKVFGKIGLLSFGGPAAQIALMHREVVDQRKWLPEDGFLRALGFAMLLPGPEAMQLATYIGWRRAGIRGGLVAGGLFVIPGAMVMLALAGIYAQWGSVPIVAAAMVGVQIAVIGIVINAVFKLAAKALKSVRDWGIAVGSFVMMFAFSVPFPLVILAAAIIGATGNAKPAAPMPQIKARPVPIVVMGALIWAVPIGVAFVTAPIILTEIGLFFSKLAVVTFGGAYAVLAYMAQTVVGDLGWISAQDMITGLGLAETTPGPLILVTEFVGFMSGFHAGGWGLAMAAAAMTLWVTFVPCFIWIFAGAPYVEALPSFPRVSAALAGVTAAVVGVIANLSVWFALHVLWRSVDVAQFGIAEIMVPTGPKYAAMILAVALWALGRRAPLWAVLLVGAAGGIFIGIS